MNFQATGILIGKKYFKVFEMIQVQIEEKGVFMKKSLLSIFVVFAFVGVFNAAHAEDSKPAPKASEHSMEKMPAAAQGSEAGMGHGMMGDKMNMEQMHSMMHDCMQKSKDGKMCEGQAMEQCQKNMDKKECKKMMKDSKKSKK